MFRKIALFSLVLFILSVVSVYAQQGRQRLSPEEQAKATIKTLTEKLTLTEDQVKKLTDLLTKNNEEFAKIRESMQGDMAGMREARQKNQTELNKKIDALLDAKQKEAFVKYNKEQEEARAAAAAQRQRQQ